MKKKEVEEINDMSYEDEMLLAFVGNPEKLFWYKKAFAKYNVNGVKNFAWNWSWYAFFFSFWYLLYRKVYGVSAVLFGIYVLFGALGGFLGLIANVIMGGALPYYVYERYIAKKDEIEKNITDRELRIATMERIGGTNSFIVYITLGFFIFFTFIFFMYMLSTILFILSSGH